MSKEWSPFREAECRLSRYNHFFPCEKVRDAFDHPQELEDWLDINCPKNYCYVWVWNDNSIADNLLGVPKKVVLAIKLMTSVNLVSNEKLEIKSWQTNTGETQYRVQQRVYFK